MDRFAIFGDPVSHSLSPLMHNHAFRALQIDACYGRYRLVDGGALRERFFTLGIKGANITVPHKEHAYRACDELDPFALRVGAVNTIVERDGRLHGYNTDAAGFLRAIGEFGGKRVLFLGAGSTARSTAVILRDIGYSVTILNRSAGRLERFVRDGFDTYLFEDFPPSVYDIVVNMTSAGLEDDSLPAPLEIFDELLPQAGACIDVIYGKQTPFLQLAQKLGKPTRDGSDMLLYQGVIAFDIFTRHRYDMDTVERYMRQAFV